jgi:hypothetical protein
MNRLWYAVALALVTVGCASEGDQPPWKRPGLMGGVPPGFFDEALKDARGDNQRMSTDIPAGERPSGSHTPMD